MRFLVFAAALLFFPRPAFCFCSEPKPSVLCEYLNSDAVFVGKVVSLRAVTPRGQENDGWLYTLRVEELFRGPKSETIDVFTENSSGRYPLDNGKEYLLFATKVDGRFEIYNCGNNALLSEGSARIRELRTIQIPGNAVIEGSISFSGIPDEGPHVAGVQIVLQSTDGRYSATSDKEGHFYLHVPPGAYSATVHQIPNWKIEPFDLSVDNPEHFNARAGRCSELQFLAEKD